ncbi:glycosyltransferase family 4 protein [Mucilaginibacter sp. FT3.2]|uniref:glycosyltransferase family 4 protein n=1 Tax=Mucilaginibacter sp. FT3.2 TaxID=2723090 RepID=UPI0016230C79|nr:glycosyltransferase family 4 protein [Mucilaginibacter sp. FT3.2]MBB6231316.1 glycosyltransferase involved in cell wall biosynthesis [Mucilaginibacter sp. FT3.2]
MRLAIITTHPIQYYAPVFKLLAEQMDVKVFYTWGTQAQEKFDPGFGKTITWDIPLLEGYPYEWVKNTAPDPGSHHFKGIVNPELINQINTWQAEAILVYGWAYDSHLKVIRHFKNKLPLYFRGDSTLLDIKKGPKQALRSVFLRWVYNHINHAFYVGSNNKAYFKKYGLKDGQLSFAPHAIDNNRFAANSTDEAAKIRSGLGIKPNDVLVLFAGKLEEKKSPQLLLDAFLTLNMPNTHLLFVGNGILEIALKTNASKSNNVHFITFQNQSAMPAIYQACNLFCLPSQGPGETWGLAVNEAMAAGKPVLVSDKCGCAANLVIPGVTGQIFEAANFADITTKLHLLIKDRARLAILGGNAKEKIAAWSFNNQAAAILNTINNTHAN